MAHPLKPGTHRCLHVDHDVVVAQSGRFWRFHAQMRPLCAGNGGPSRKSQISDAEVHHGHPIPSCHHRTWVGRMRRPRCRRGIGGNEADACDQPKRGGGKKGSDGHGAPRRRKCVTSLMLLHFRRTADAMAYGIARTSWTAPRQRRDPRGGTHEYPDSTYGPHALHLGDAVAVGELANGEQCRTRDVAALNNVVPGP